MCTIVHTQENDRIWIGFAEFAKGSVRHEGGLLARHREGKNLVKVFDVRDSTPITSLVAQRGIPNSKGNVFPKWHRKTPTGCLTVASLRSP